MKNKFSKLTILLAAILAATACGTTTSSSSSKEQTSSNEPVVTSNVATTSSEEEVNTSSKQDESSQKTSASSEQQSSEQQSSSSYEEDPNFAYKDYLVKHDEGTSVEYIFEAECTNLETKEGLGYSGTATESAMASHDSSNRAFVTYLYKIGLSINFIIVCDRDVNDAVLKATLGGEFMHVQLDPSSYSFRVDTIITEEDLDEAFGNWDEAFLNYYTDLDETGGYYVNSWDCEAIDIDATGLDAPSLWQTFQITSKLELKKGVNCISLITMNATSPGAGTMAAIAPVVDNISIVTGAQMGMYKACDNGEGTVGCTIKA